MINIVDDHYDRRSVDLNMGERLIVVNKTNNTYTLKTIPDGNLPYIVVDPMETEHVPFDSPGTYTLTSQEHPETTIQVVVAERLGPAAAAKPVATIDLGANGALSQTEVKLTEGQSLVMTNSSKQTVHVNSEPALDLGMGYLVIHPGERQIMVFSNVGTYVCAVSEHPSQRLTVRVSKS